MGTKEIKTCDKCCKDNIPNIRNIYIQLGRIMDAAGDIDDDYITFDLCLDCMECLIELTYTHNWDINKLKSWLTNYR
jgi:hypothetical protein